MSRAYEMLARILEVHPRAAAWSTEIAGFKGRLLWQTYQRTGAASDLRAARDTYTEALEVNTDSHYMADNVGQLSLLLDEKDVARQAFSKGLEALNRTGDRGYWALATRASCHLGLGQTAEGLAALCQITMLEPEPAIFDSIRRGLRRLHKGLGGTPEQLEVWLAALEGGEAERPTH